MNIGILGGSFDPIHCGHLNLAKLVLGEFHLDAIWFMPNNIPVHKKSSACTKDRVQMLKLSLEGEPNLLVSTIEVDRTGPSYTYTTLNELKYSYPNDTFFFLLGMDSWITLPTWYKWDELFKLCNFIVCKRKFDKNLKKDVMQLILKNRLYTQLELPKTYGHVLLLEAEVYPYSSTQVRDYLKKGETLPKGLITPLVYDYIKANKLYVQD